MTCNEGALKEVVDKMDRKCEETRVLHLKTEVENQAKVIQALERQLKAQRESIRYVRGDSDEGQSNEDTNIVMPNCNEMNEFELMMECACQTRTIDSLLRILEQGMEDLLEPSRRDKVEVAGTMIRMWVRELKRQPAQIEYLKTGNDQALRQDWSTVDIGIELPSLEEMNKLDIKVQIELQNRILDTLTRTLEPGRMKIAELERENHQRQHSVDTILVQAGCDEVRGQIDPRDSGPCHQVAGIQPESRDEARRTRQIPELVSSRLECSRSLASKRHHECHELPRGKVSADSDGEVEKLIGDYSPIGAGRRRNFRAGVREKAAVSAGDSHGASISELPFRDPVW
jgi:hypothetical protein